MLSISVNNLCIALHCVVCQLSVPGCLLHVQCSISATHLFLHGQDVNRQALSQCWCQHWGTRLFSQLCSRENYPTLFHYTNKYWQNKCCEVYSNCCRKGQTSTRFWMKVLSLLVVPVPEFAPLWSHPRPVSGAGMWGHRQWCGQWGVARWQVRTKGHCNIWNPEILV